MTKEEGEERSEGKPPTLQYARPATARRTLDPVAIIGYILIGTVWVLGLLLVAAMLWGD